MRRARVPGALAVLLVAGTLAACGGGGDSSGGSESADRGVAKAPAAPSAERAPAGGTENGTGGGRTGERGGSPRPQAPLDAGREVVHTARLQVRAKDVDASATKAKQLVGAVGGYVERESSSTDPARSEITLKIPVARYGEVLDQLGTQLGAKLSLTQEAEDVTGEVADVEARVRSAKATLDTYRKLLGRAGSITEIMNIENEIAGREADLEALQARQKALKNRTRFATVTVLLVGKSVPADEKDDRGGFVGALGDGWHALTAFAGGVAVLLGWLLPFLVAAAVIGAPALVFRRRLRARFGRRRPSARASAPENPAG
ncbi:DUF4349 domain-containing protein [Actinomadura decatromicini]|nr:DUF4349 domain-containing protein [Actinomadura decatromicini]